MAAASTRRPHSAALAGTAFAAVALLGACVPLTRSTAPMPSAFVGQWVAIADAGPGVERLRSATRAGFVAIGPELVVIDCPGLPRSSAHPREVALQDGVGGGRVTLDDGVRLYLALGRGWAETAAGGEAALASADYLDIDAYRVVDERDEPLGRVRLWAEPGVRLAASAIHVDGDRPSAHDRIAARDDRVTRAADAAPSERGDGDDRALIDAAARWPAAGRAADELNRRIADRAERDALVAERDRLLGELRADILADLAEARADRARAPALIARARDRQAALAAWSAASARRIAARG